MESAFTSHYLVPKAERLAPEETEKLLAELKTTLENLPLIKETDPMCVALQAKQGDVLKITRSGPFVEKTFFYRLVVE